jgi:hypothetical protein
LDTQLRRRNACDVGEDWWSNVNASVFAPVVDLTVVPCEDLTVGGPSSRVVVSF